jgi:hypothetical protein
MQISYLRYVTIQFITFVIFHFNKYILWDTAKFTMTFHTSGWIRAFETGRNYLTSAVMCVTCIHKISFPSKVDTQPVKKASVLENPSSYPMDSIPSIWNQCPTSDPVFSKNFVNFESNTVYLYTTFLRLPSYFLCECQNSTCEQDRTMRQDK